MNDKEYKISSSTDKTLDVLSSVRFIYNIKEEQMEKSCNNSWRVIKRTIHHNQPNRFRIIYWKYATIAVVITLLAITGLFLKTVQKQNEIQFTYCPYGERRELKLPDGSRVWLNAGSQLVYPELFSGKSREVFLIGEAFFDVTTNRKPFIVKSEDIAVKVLGTRFNVKSYPNEADTEITLESGSIGFDKINNQFDKIVFLFPNQRAKISKETGKIIIEDVNSIYYTEWKDGRIHFRAEKFEHIAITLERIYNVKIDIRSDKLKNEIYTGRFEYEETVDRILNLIELNTKMGYIQKDRVYTVYEK